MAAGDIDLVLGIYDDDMVFLNQAREEKRGKEAFGQEVAPLVARNPKFDFNIEQVIKAGDIAQMHTKEWKASPPPPQPMSTYANEVVRRQVDGTWRWLLDDPFTVGRNISS